jgi:nicotinamidase-related amidase
MSQNPRRALVVIDVQNDYDVDGNLPIEYPDVHVSLANIGKAMDAARAANIPVIVVQTVAPAGAPMFADGTAGVELHPVVASRAHDHLVVKRLPSAFAGTDLGEWLQERRIDTLAVAGYMTHNCDYTTALHAGDAGLAVEFLSDASGSVPYANRAGRASAEEIHRAFTVVLQSRFAAVLSTDEWVAALRTGTEPERDSIYASNQRARQLAQRR